MLSDQQNQNKYIQCEKLKENLLNFCQKMAQVVASKVRIRHRRNGCLNPADKKSM